MVFAYVFHVVQPKPVVLESPDNSAPSRDSHRAPARLSVPRQSTATAAAVPGLCWDPFAAAFVHECTLQTN